MVKDNRIPNPKSEETTVCSQTVARQSDGTSDDGIGCSRGVNLFLAERVFDGRAHLAPEEYSPLSGRGSTTDRRVRLRRWWKWIWPVTCVR